VLQQQLAACFHCMLGAFSSFKGLRPTGDAIQPLQVNSSAGTAVQAMLAMLY
jgi:hypothetical protein